MTPLRRSALAGLPPSPPVTCRQEKRPFNVTPALATAETGNPLE